MQANHHRLRILLAIGIYEPENGGAAEWVRNYAKWLVQRGHDVCVVCERMTGPPPESCKWLALPAQQHTKNSRQRARALQDLIKSQPADIVHDTGCLLESDVFHPLMGSLIHNWSRQLRAYPPGLRVRRFWQIRLWRDVRLQLHQQRHHRLLIACSQRVAADFARLGQRRAKVILNGIPALDIPDAETVRLLRQELRLGERLLVLMTAANLRLKGVMTALQAMIALETNTRKRFLIIVTGHEADEPFPQFIRENGLEDHCRLIGRVENIEDYYHAADIFLHPTFHDAGSLSTLKALAAGKAVVTSSFDGSAEMIEHGVNGLILKKPGDAKELAEILRRLLDSDLRERLGAAARKLAPIINQERQFEQLEQVYFDVLREKGCAP